MLIQKTRGITLNVAQEQTDFYYEPEQPTVSTTNSPQLVQGPDNP